MAEAMSKIDGAKFRYTEIPDNAHGIWTPVYSLKDLPEWLLSHKRSDR
jgi:hypothetical protein